MSWLWMLLAFVTGLALGVVVTLVIEQAKDIDLGPGEEWWI